MNDTLYETLMKLPRANLISVMWDALDEMHTYNGRTRHYCILKSMGLEETENDKGRAVFKQTSLYAIKKHTNNNPLI